MTRLPSASPSLRTACDLVLDHPADRDAGPVGDDAGHRLRVDASAGSAATRPAAPRACACSSCSSASSVSRSIGCGAPRRRAGGASTSAASRLRAVPVDRLVVAAQLARAARGSCRRAPSPPSSAARARPGARARAPSFSSTSLRARADVDADRCLAVDDRRARSRAPRCAAGSPRPRPASRAG